MKNIRKDLLLMTTRNNLYNDWNCVYSDEYNIHFLTANSTMLYNAFLLVYTDEVKTNILSKIKKRTPIRINQNI